MLLRAKRVAEGRKEVFLCGNGNRGGTENSTMAGLHMSRHEGKEGRDCVPTVRRAGERGKWPVAIDQEDKLKSRL